MHKFIFLYFFLSFLILLSFSSFLFPPPKPQPSRHRYHRVTCVTIAIEHTTDFASALCISAAALPLPSSHLCRITAVAPPLTTAPSHYHSCRSSTFVVCTAVRRCSNAIRWKSKPLLSLSLLYFPCCHCHLQQPSPLAFQFHSPSADRHQCMFCLDSIHNLKCRVGICDLNHYFKLLMLSGPLTT